jgi:UDP-N-acetylmuramyl pentapeptide phosphotransferase/UDP-N-acetylglucosamine-1-phosphate transferase
MTSNSPIFATMLVSGAATLSAGLIVLLRPLLRRYALARPNARSLHREPTPQGGGIAVVVAALAAAFAAAWLLGADTAAWRELFVLALATVGLAALGGVDDVRPLPALPRLVLQLASAGLAVWMLPPEWRLLPPAPLWLERAVFVVGLAWYVNLTNFMDGMDWMTVAETVPVAFALALFAGLGVLPAHVAFLALGLLGGMLGFAPFNAPIARLFLGDVGSLPVGLLVGYGLLDLALAGEFAAAVLLPMYYLADSGITLARRFARGAKLTQAHREHFYQLAAARGWSTRRCIAHVFLVNVVLLALALASHFITGIAASLSAIMVGMLVVAWLLRRFAGAASKPVLG